MCSSQWPMTDDRWPMRITLTMLRLPSREEHSSYLAHLLFVTKAFPFNQGVISKQLRPVDAAFVSELVVLSTNGV
jgi:hypothetical protein